MDIPGSPKATTPEWLNDALAGHGDSTPVRSITVDDIVEGTGIFGEIARLTIANNAPTTSAPRSAVVKLPCTEPENLAVARRPHYGVRSRRLSRGANRQPSQGCHRGPAGIACCVVGT